jgi:menaquinone-specific isochorismate synthase
MTQPSKHIDLDTGNVESIEDIYKEEWRDLVKETIAKLNDESKVVLARKRLVEFDKPINIAYILKQAMQGEKNSYLVVLESANSIFFSQTPEQLMEVEDEVLYTKAIAGTISRSHDETIDQRNIDAFLNDTKNLNEHQFVVKSILHDINPYVNAIQYNDSPKILANDHLFHLLTEIKGDLKSESYIGLLDNLHPTPALGGFPKERAVKYIDEHEFGTRGLYGAPVGYIDMYDNCEFVVAIRSMLIKGQSATLYAGCGIVNNSNPDSEVEETAIKFTPMMKALGVDKDDES